MTENYLNLTIKEIGYKIRLLTLHKNMIENREVLVSIYNKIEKQGLTLHIENGKPKSTYRRNDYMKKHYHNKYTPEYFDKEIQLLTDIRNKKIDNIKNKKIDEKMNKKLIKEKKKEELKNKNVKLDIMDEKVEIVDELYDHLTVKELGYKLKAVKKHLDFLVNGKEERLVIYKDLYSKWVQANVGNPERKNDEVFKNAYI